MSQYAFSLTNGKRIAQLICPQKKNNKYIYLYNKKYKAKLECKDTKTCKCSRGKCDTLEYHKDNNESETHNKFITPNKCRFMLSPTNIVDTVSNLFVSGEAGSGKSVFIREYTKGFKELYKKIPVILISECTEDKNLDSVINKRVSPEQIRDEELKFSDFESMAKDYNGLLIIFDDIDSIDDSRKSEYLRDTVYTLMNALINNSRKHNIHIIFSSHRPLEGAKKTGVMLNSCSSWVFFASSMTMQQTQNCAIDKFNLTKDQYDKLKEIVEENNSHWVAINRTIPMTCCTEHNILKVSDLVDEKKIKKNIKNSDEPMPED